MTDRWILRKRRINHEKKRDQDLDSITFSTPKYGLHNTCKKGMQSIYIIHVGYIAKGR
jgi:hypothetical protein